MARQTRLHTFLHGVTKGRALTSVHLANVERITTTMPEIVFVAVSVDALDIPESKETEESGMTDKATDHKEANVPEDLKHGLNCAAWTNSLGFEVNAEECTCGLRYRERISTLASELAEARQTIAKRDALLDQMSANNDTLRIELAAKQKTIERLSAPVSVAEETANAHVDDYGINIWDTPEVNALLAARLKGQDNE